MFEEVSFVIHEVLSGVHPESAERDLTFRGEEETYKFISIIHHRIKGFIY